MKKVTATLILSIFIILLSPGATAAAGDTLRYAVTGGSIYIDRGTGYVVSADESITDAVIPEEVSGITVTGIGDSAFYKCTKLTHVFIPSTVKFIGKFPFEACINLDSIEIADEQFRKLALSGDRNGGLDDEEEGRTTVSWYAFYGVGPAVYGHDLDTSYKHSPYYTRLRNVRITGDPRSDVMNIAVSQLGYREGFSMHELDGSNTKEYETPAGVTSDMQYEWGHYTEMSRHRGIQGTTWCAAFVYWCYAMAGIPDDIVGAGTLAVPKNKRDTINVYRWEDMAYSGGGTYEIQPADILHLGKSHYALVRSVRTYSDRVRITYIEGNGNDRGVDEDYILVDAATGETVRGNYELDRVDSPDFSKMKYHTLTFDGNGGQCEQSGVRIAERAIYGVLPEPEREGYDFDGWYTKPDGGEEALPYTRFRGKSDATLYAHWSKSPFSDSYKKSEYYEELMDVELTGDYRDDVLNVARSQIGYHEGDHEDDLDGSNLRGDENYSEYGRYFDTNGTAWCSEFISWCLRMAKVPEDIIKSSTSASVKKFASPYKTWADTVYAGGSYRMRKGDILLFAHGEKNVETATLYHSAFFYGAKRMPDGTVAIRLLEGNSYDMVTTEIMYVYPDSGYDAESVPGDGYEDFHIAAIITPDYEPEQ